MKSKKKAIMSMSRIALSASCGWSWNCIALRSDGPSGRGTDEAVFISCW